MTMQWLRPATLVLAATLAACSAPTPVTSSPTPSGPVAVQITDKTKGELQAVLQTQRDALVKRDLKAYQTTFDGGRSAFRRCKQESFDIAGRQGASSSAPQIVKVEPFGTTYARAWVDEGPNTGVSRTYFRIVDGKWVQTEPTSDEIGPSKKTTVSGIDIEYWAIDDDIVDALGKGTVAAKDSVIQNQLTESKQLFGIRFYPTRGEAGIVECSVVGFHLPNKPDDKFVRFFRYWFTPDTKQMSAPTISFIQHEGLHWAQDQFIPGISARLDWWLVEGWPDFIGQSRSTEYKRTVICATGTPTYKQLADGPRTDLPETNPEDAVRYYAFANTMIEYLYAQFGANAYKQLLLAYKDLADPNKNLPAVLKVTPAEYHAGWIAFAKKKYC
jgi:hypothetical protein